jgi:hypothetical protein
MCHRFLNLFYRVVVVVVVVAAWTSSFIVIGDPVEPQLITFTDFEDKTYQQFTTSGGGTEINTNQGRACEGDVSVRLKRASTLYHKAPAFDVSQYDDFILSFWYFPYSAERDDALLVQYSSEDGASWETLIRIEMGVEHAGQSYDQMCHQKIIQFSALMVDPASIDSIRLRFQAQTNNRNDEFYIDGVRLEGIMASESTPTGGTPSATPSIMPTAFVEREDICPLNKTFPSQKYKILEYPNLSGLTYVEDDLSEISGLVFASLRDDLNSKYAYAISDKNQYSVKVLKFTESYDSSSLWSGTADTVAVYTLTNINYDNDDWEDISTGPCTGNSNNDAICLYIGNFGNNDRGGPEGYDYQRRRQMSIFKFPEPDFSGPDGTPIDRDISASIIYYDYTTTFRTDKFIDAEAMFVDWTGAHGVGKGDIYVVIKGYCGGGGVGRIAAAKHSDLLPGQEIDVGSMEGVREDPPPQGNVGCQNAGTFRVYQAADMSRNGKLIALATGASPSRTYFFPRETGQSVADAISGSHCSYVSATSFGLINEKRFEAVAFLDDEGTIFAETSECTDGNNCQVPIYFHTLTWDPPSTSRTASLDSAGWQKITYDGFENSSLGHYETRPGNTADPDAALSSAFPCQGNAAVRLRWDNGVSSSIYHRQNQDCTSFEWLKVSFQFQLDSVNVFDHMDALFLEVSLNGGTDYTVVAVWAYDVDDINTWGVCYQRTVELFAQDFGRENFGNAVRLRFRASANAKSDLVHVDDIRFEGHTGFDYIRL